MAVAKAPRLIARDEIVHGLIAQHRDLRVQQSAINIGALAGFVTAQQGRLNGVGGVEARVDIGDGHAGFRGGTIGLAGEMHGAAHALHQKIIARTLCVGPILPKARDRAIDQAGVQPAQARVVEAIFGEAPHLEILDDDVGLHRQALDEGAALRRLEIRLDATLAAIAGVVIGGAEVLAIMALQKGRAPLARIVARPAPLHLHHVGPEVGEQLPAPGTGENARELQHAKMGEGFGRGGQVRSPCGAVATSSHGYKAPPEGARG